ncbi:hypothetical protein CLAFUW4_12688 [Fulvia fulva]|nr:hypothetical protein CLAFUR4_12693 [Fulvia fulva]KAK4612643.1 hypothetical protein CLAFUR0_12699 [Fulvia fulva]WPV21559.1 hypothetical protein CLAFUW4_12688 [Fulvia fulva]WPV36586.1 hypothetical protein CLAFUW7_12695 [Fulvia fulva]
MEVPSTTTTGKGALLALEARAKQSEEEKTSLLDLPPEI